MVGCGKEDLTLNLLNERGYENSNHTTYRQNYRIHSLVTLTSIWSLTGVRLPSCERMSFRGWDIAAGVELFLFELCDALRFPLDRDDGDIFV